MLRLPCPHCGQRDVTEFTYGGDASACRPDTITPVDDQRWAGYLFMRTDSVSDHVEYWHHTFGCRSWVRAQRNTGTNEVMAAVLARSDRRST